MNRFTNRLVSVWLVLLFGALSVLAVPTKEQWLNVRSRNFNLVGNASEKEIRNVGAQLEQFREVFTRLFSKRNYDGIAPITVIVFKNDGAFKPYKPLYQGKPANVSGYFQGGEDVNYIMLSAERRNDQNPFAVIFHELTHVYTLANARPLPPWLSEGIAEYYSTFKLSDGDQKAWLGEAIAHHVLLLRDRKPLPLPALFSVTHGSADYNERERQSIFYAQSWALTHYLILGNNQARQKQLMTFINLLANGQAVASSFQQAFNADFATVEKELQKYLQNTSFPVQYVAFEQKLQFANEMTVAPLSEAQVAYYLGDALARLKRPTDALTHLQQAITLEPKLAEAHTAIGMLHLREQRYAEAKQALQQAVAADSKDYRAHYYYAYAVSRDVFGENKIVTNVEPAVAQTLRTELRKAIALAPNFAESYRLLAMVELIAGERLAEAVQHLQQARKLLPGKQEFALLLAQVYLRQGKYDLAQQTLAPVLASPSDEMLRQQAQNYADIVQRMADQQARFKEVGAAERPQPVGDPQFKEVTEAELKAEEANGTSNLPRVLLRRKVEGETLRGQLTRVDCTSKGITLTIKPTDNAGSTNATTAAVSVQLFTATPDKLQFITYTQAMGEQFTCGAITPARTVSVTYRKATDAKAKVFGEPLIVEFLPPEGKAN